MEHPLTSDLQSPTPPICWKNTSGGKWNPFIQFNNADSKQTLILIAIEDLKHCEFIS